MELSIVMPCYNEEATVSICVSKAIKIIEQHQLDAEVIVADNLSEDLSAELACAAGAKVVSVSVRGYGGALQGGIQQASGKYIIMGDADDSYDFLAIMPILQQLREGKELVIGNRFTGEIKPHAMPLIHKYFGNPGLSLLAKVFFRSPVGDIYCGLRGFNRDKILELDLRSTGMEYAIEMIVKATIFSLKICELPITLHKDGRGKGSHLRTWRDGWRTLRFMLLYAPAWLFLFPGFLLLITGGLAMAILIAKPLVIMNIGFDVNTILVTTMSCIIGIQLICFFFIAKIFAVSQGFLPNLKTFNKFFRYINLELGIITGLTIAALGLGGLLSAILDWGNVNFGALSYAQILRKTIPATGAIVVGMQIIFSSFLMSIVSLSKK